MIIVPNFVLAEGTYEGIKGILIINRLLLCFPQYKQNPEMFKQTARLWSHVYAGAPVSSPEYTRKIDKLCAMGFEKVHISLFLFFFFF